MKLVTVAFLSIQLAGCMGSGFGFGDSAADAGLTTASVPAKPVDTISDEVTIRNAVTSADLAKLNGEPLPWANTDTGSAGVVDTIMQSQDGRLICRDFTTTSHSFHGISKYRGQACLTGKGEWQLVSFEKSS